MAWGVASCSHLRSGGKGVPCAEGCEGVGNVAGRGGENGGFCVVAAGLSASRS